MLKGRDIVLNAFTDLLDYLCRCRELKEYICVILNTDVGPKGNAVNKIKKTDYLNSLVIVYVYCEIFLNISAFAKSAWKYNCSF